LPLRGKILNTEQASIQKITASQAIKDLITAIGT
jgi:DNA gyrase/topoisomerase IV subunit B